jgi:putative Mn2+ efflux pump MntP
MIELLLLAIALSMDGFAVSIGIGAQQSRVYLKPALLVALYLGGFHFIMTMAGYNGGLHLFSWFESVSKWIAFALLLGIGLKTIVEVFQQGTAESSQQTSHNKLVSSVINLKHSTLLLLALAASIDAFAAGFTLVLFATSALLSCAIIGIISFCFSLLGFYFGKRMGDYLQEKANLLGGSILILIAFKILLF